jgi:hypothetical protein
LWEKTTKKLSVGVGWGGVGPNKTSGILNSGC